MDKSEMTEKLKVAALLLAESEKENEKLNEQVEQLKSRIEYLEEQLKDSIENDLDYPTGIQDTAEKSRSSKIQPVLGVKLSKTGVQGVLDKDVRRPEITVHTLADVLVFDEYSVGILFVLAILLGEQRSGMNLRTEKGDFEIQESWTRTSTSFGVRIPGRLKESFEKRTKYYTLGPRQTISIPQPLVGTKV